MQNYINEKFWLIVLRVALGFVFFWAFLDKTFGLGFATKPENSWLHGGSPTSGFLSHAVHGPFAQYFNSLSGLVWVDWAFMLGLFFVGVTLITGKYLKAGAFAGIIMLALMYLSLLWPTQNPILDEHIIYILVLCLFVFNKDSI